jgi:two-component sensor histidine kinase
LSAWWEMKDDTFRLTWAETGGPEVEAPTKTGFGGSLIEMTIVRQFGGTVQYDWLPEGLSALIQMPRALFT